MRHLPSSAIERINQFEFGEKLWLAHEFQNPYDTRALILNTEDHYIVGYCPRYLLAEIFELLQQNSNLEVRVERLNKPPTPLQFRLLCKMSVNAINNFRLFSSSQCQPINAELATPVKSSS